MREEMLALTKKLVSIASVNTTDGEGEIGVFIEAYLREIPYFKKHPDQIIVQELREDREKNRYHRRNVFALVIGEKERKPDTLVFHGHTDTVGVEDYAGLKDYAFDCDRLMEELRKMELPREVREDLESGDYLFGRGACDMKSGDAVFLALIRKFAEKADKLSGNLLLSLNPVEENLHTGVIEGCDVLLALREKYGLTYRLAINNDYTCPMYSGDPHHYIYTGVVGKLLPCFYIQGNETHVGQCFEGFDASVAAAKLVDKISLNSEYCDAFHGEYSLPPVALKMKDLKTWYNVQTAKEALVYFNYFVYNADMSEIMAKLLAAGSWAMEQSLLELNEKYRAFCGLTGDAYMPIRYEYEVIPYGELVRRAEQKAGEDRVRELLSGRTRELEAQGVDKREVPVFLIRELLAVLKLYQPLMVLYFAAPYCPHNTLQEKDRPITEKLTHILSQVEQEEQITYKMCSFFPSLSDSSYLRIDDSEASIALLSGNFPQMEILYPLPLEKIRSLNIPAVDFGVYGKDAHKWTERVNISYSFEVLPRLIEKTVHEFLD